MIGIVIITHGNLANELAGTVKLIMGEQKDIATVTLTAKDSIETLREHAMAAVHRFQDPGCLIMTDVLGGSPTNICVELLRTDWVRILCGVNLPMVMSALQYRETLELSALSAKVRDGAMKGIVDLKEFYQERAKKK